MSKCGWVLLAALFVAGCNKNTRPPIALIAATADAARLPVARQAEEVFFQVFLHQPAARQKAETLLMAAFASDGNDARTNLLLGLLHLWALAEGPTDDPTALERAILGDYHLARYLRLNPGDRRVASWHIPLRMTLASVERTPERLPGLMAEFHAACARDPYFHAVSLSMREFHRPVDSAEFRQGRELLRRADEGCSHQAAPDCMNRPRWAHNEQGFMLLRADYALRAGDVKEADALLRAIPQKPGWDTFPFKGEVDRRLADLAGHSTRLAQGDRATPMIMDTASGIGCQICHRAE